MTLALGGWGRTGISLSELQGSPFWRADTCCRSWGAWEIDSKHLEGSLVEALSTGFLAGRAIVGAGMVAARRSLSLFVSEHSGPARERAGRRADRRVSLLLAPGMAQNEDLVDRLRRSGLI